jgi:hypothetical protein
MLVQCHEEELGSCRLLETTQNSTYQNHTKCFGTTMIYTKWWRSICRIWQLIVHVLKFPWLSYSTVVSAAKASGEPVCGRLYPRGKRQFSLSLSLSLSLASALLLSRHVFQFLKLEFHTREIVFQDVMLCIKSTNRSIVIQRRSALMMTSFYSKRKRKNS